MNALLALACSLARGTPLGAPESDLFLHLERIVALALPLELTLEVMRARQPLGLDVAAFNRREHSATRFVMMAAVPKAAARRQRVDFGKASDGQITIAIGE